LRLHVIAAAALAVVAAAAEAGHLERHVGADVFKTAGCANCHALAAVGANGRVGPTSTGSSPTPRSSSAR
jgi:cytochrome c2